MIKKWLSDRDFSFILKGSAYSIISKVFVTLSSVVINYIIAHYYGADALGRYALIQSFLAVACLFSEAGLRTSLVRLLPEYSSRFSKAVSFQIYKKSHYLLFFLSIALSVILLFFIEPIQSLLFSSSEKQLSVVLYLAVGAILFRTLKNVNIEAFRARARIKLYSIFNAVPNFIELFLLLLITFIFASGTNIPIYAHLLSLVITGIVFFSLNIFSFPKEQKKFETKEIGYKSIFEVSFPLFLVAAMNIIIAKTDILMIGIFMTEADVGIYQIVYKVGILLIFVLSAISSIAAPKFSELYHQNNIEALEKAAHKTTTLILFCTLPILIGLIIFGKMILGVFGPEFEAGYIPLLILLVGQFVNSLTGPVGYLLSMTEYQNIVRNTTLLAGSINISLNFILIPLWGITGAAVATGASLAIKNLINYYQVRKYLGLNVWKITTSLWT